MDIPYNGKELVVVEYPGTVKNVQKMMATFGGEDEMNSVFNDSSKRLGLRFRPEDPYCKCVHGDRFNTTNLILKVTKRRKKSSNLDSVNFRVEIVGLACTTYKFKSLADFQILPQARDSKTGYRTLVDDLVPNALHAASWLDTPAPLFIQPLVYSRFDQPQNGYYEMISKTLKDPSASSCVTRNRKRRAGYAVFTSFESPETCCEPLPQALTELKRHPLDSVFKEKVDELFQERPIWSRNAILTRLGCDKHRLRYSLSCTAYYFTTGPWRTLWVKFGYDPRKDPSSKIYQVMDFRVNPAIKLNEDKSSRSKSQMGCPHPAKVNQASQRIPTINTNDLMPSAKDEPDSLESSNRSEYFPGVLPAFRQCFYQLCDIHLADVQELVHLNDGHEQTCHEKDGWCEVGTLEKCRELLTNDLMKSIKNLKKALN